MSLKENIDFIKGEISTEESFMENFFKLEKFYKKYKIVLLSSVVIVVLGTIGYYTKSYINQQNQLQANIAFNKLLKNINDKEAKAILIEKNKKLYSIAQFLNNNSSNTNVEFLKEISQYTKAINSNSIDMLATSVQEQSFLLKDFALMNKAILEAKKKDYKSAKETIQLITKKSEVAPMKTMLEHFLLTK